MTLQSVLTVLTWITLTKDTEGLYFIIGVLNMAPFPHSFQWKLSMQHIKTNASLSFASVLSGPHVNVSEVKVLQIFSFHLLKNHKSYNWQSLLFGVSTVLLTYLAKNYTVPRHFKSFVGGPTKACVGYFKSIPHTQCCLNTSQLTKCKGIVTNNCTTHLVLFE